MRFLLKIQRTSLKLLNPFLLLMVSLSKIFTFLLISILTTISGSSLFATSSALEAIGDEGRLLGIAERENELREAVARPDGRFLSEDTVLREVQSIITLYERYLREFPEDGTALLLYGKFLRAVGRPYEAAVVLLRLDELDGSIPVVKQQLGNLAAEEGDYGAALSLFNDAIRLAPLEATYQFQLGFLLSFYANQIVAAEILSRSALDAKMLEAFENASLLEPANRDFKARWAEAFYDVGDPDWEEALGLWEDLARTPVSENEDQVISLHRARVLLELGRYAEVQPLLERVSHPALEGTRRDLEERLEAAS
jgi:hypothetical protein